MSNDIHIVEPITAFGEVAVAQNTPVVQIDAVTGLRESIDVISTVLDTGTTSAVVTGSGREFRVSTGIGTAARSELRSKRSAKYRPGQGMNYKITARFGTPKANSKQIAGVFNTGTEFTFGYSGVAFGIFYNTGGLQEIRELTVTAAAGGVETASITLDGTLFSVPINSTTIAGGAIDIAAATFAGWTVTSNGSTVLFQSVAVGPRIGTYLISSTGTLDGTYASLQTGVLETETFLPQNEWNIDTMDGGVGANPSGMELNPLKGNVYRIEQQYLGYGSILFGIESPANGRFVNVHNLQYANVNDSPSMMDPVMFMCWAVENSGNNTDVELHGSSAAAFVEGLAVPFRNPDGHGGTKSGVTTTLTNIISFRVRGVFNNIAILNEVLPHFAAFAVDGTKPAVVQLMVNPTLGGVLSWEYHDKANSVLEINTAATTVVKNAATLDLFEVPLGRLGEVSVVMPPFSVRLVPGDIITLAAKATANTTDVSVSLGWFED